MFITALSSLLPQLPIICVMVIGLVIAIVRWQKHRRVSSLLVISLSLEIASYLIYTLFAAVLINSGIDATEIRSLFNFVAIGMGLFRALMLGLILWATFGWRTFTHIE